MCEREPAGNSELIEGEGQGALRVECLNNKVRG